MQAAIDDLFTPESCRAARALLDMNQAALADAAGVSRPVVIEFERGTRTSAATRQRLRAALEDRGIAFVPGGATLKSKSRRQSPGDALLARALRNLQRNAPRLRRLGVQHLSIFGSLARGEASDQSDVDVLVDLDPRRRLDIVDYAGIFGEIEKLVGRPIDLARRDRLKPHVAGAALADEIRAF